MDEVGLYKKITESGGIMWPTYGAGGSLHSRPPCRTRWLRPEWPGLSLKVPGTSCHRISAFYCERIYRCTFLITASILFYLAYYSWKCAICLWLMTHKKCFRPHSSVHDYMSKCQITCGGRSRWCQAWMRLSMMPSPNNPASTVSVTTKETLPAGQKPYHISKNIEKPYHISKKIYIIFIHKMEQWGLFGWHFIHDKYFYIFSRGWLPT